MSLLSHVKHFHQWRNLYKSELWSADYRKNIIKLHLYNPPPNFWKENVNNIATLHVHYPSRLVQSVSTPQGFGTDRSSQGVFWVGQFDRVWRIDRSRRYEGPELRREFQHMSAEKKDRTTITTNSCELLPSLYSCWKPGPSQIMLYELSNERLLQLWRLLKASLCHRHRRACYMLRTQTFYFRFPSCMLM